PERRPDRLAPGGAEEHGRLALRQGPPLRGLREPPAGPRRDPPGVGEPGHRLSGGPQARAGAAAARGLRRPLGPSPTRSAASPTTHHATGGPMDLYALSARQYGAVSIP